MRITCRLEFDAGHRIPNHMSECRHLHGHRYAVEITVSGAIIALEGASEQGMVMDFSDLKSIVRKNLIEIWDHAFLVYSEDHAVLSFLNSLDRHKTVVLSTIPTAENLSIEAFNLLHRAFQLSYGSRLVLEQVRLFETPTSWADAHREDLD